MAQDEFTEKMAEDQTMLNEDGYLNVDTDVKEIVSYPPLNLILIITPEGIVRVLDVNSGVILKSSSLSAQNSTNIKCMYLPTLHRVLFCDGQALGVRSDYNGVLLLDSILQKTVTDTRQEIKLELPLSEAIILKQSLNTVVSNGIEHVVNELTEAISNAQKEPKKGIKVQKWNTVCLQLPLEDLQQATFTAVSNMLMKNQHIPELGVASAVHERLSELSDEKVNATDRKSMASESRRRETFSQWPHMDYQWALPDQMAQAGFYHQPNSSGDDRAMCFTCTVCLVCWERTDEPWSEHERHSPNCPFVIGEYTQNVPLSVTLATCPAVDAIYRGTNIKIIGNSNFPNWLPTANSDNLVSVFDVTGKVKRIYSFYVTHFDGHILDRLTQDLRQHKDIWSENKKFPVDKKITSLCLIKHQQQSKSYVFRPTLVCGLNLTFCSEKPSAKSSSSETFTYIVLYDFTYTKDLNTTSQENNLDTNNDPTSVPENDNLVTATSQYYCMDNSDVESEEFSYNLMKQLSSYYKTLIPGESDEVFLPPSMSVKKNHTGPRLLYDHDGNKADSINTNSFSIIFNGTNKSDDNWGDMSISDHITEVKNNQSTSKKLSYSRAIQCIGIPSECRLIPNLEITDLFITQDNGHLLVVLKSENEAKSFLIIYRLDFTETMKIIEKPVKVRSLPANEIPIEIKLLPRCDKLLDLSDGEAQGTAIIVCVDGTVRILDLNTLHTVSYGKIDGEEFISAVYCNSLDRLCASTKNGSLHFFALTNADNESSDDLDDEDSVGQCTDYVQYNLSQSSTSLDFDTFQTDIEDIKLFKNLCEFEIIKSGYCVVVPPCWSEFQQAMRQRRQPQMLNLESDLPMKTWRLQTDTTTWDEHIFEISLVTPASLGHVDVHFTLQPTSSLPHVEVTLLKQNKVGIGQTKDVKFAVDETVTIDMLHWVDNPVTSQEYLQAHNAEILAGPINISTCLDLTEQSGTVTLTGPKLFKTKVRNLLLHIRAISSKDDSSKGKIKKNDKTIGISHKTDFYMGCDVIHELSITLYTVKPSDVPHERNQRNLILESNLIVRSLLSKAVSGVTDEILTDTLDVLDWIGAIRLTRNRSCNGEAPTQQFEFIGMVEKCLTGLLHHCLLLGNRSVAHKCMRLIMTCCSGAENLGETCYENFSNSLINSVFTILDSITMVKSAAGLQWLFTLLLKVSTKETEQIISKKCVSLLGITSSELHNRTNSYHLLLRSRYGLYGTPMEPELFDIEPPFSGKNDTNPYLLSSSTQNIVNNTENNVNNECFGYSYNRESINPKDVLSTSNTKVKYKNIASLLNIPGLIETEPLHFTCVGVSEGTRVERSDSYSKVSNLNSIVPFIISTNNTQATPSKKEQFNFIHQLMMQNYLDIDSQGTTSSSNPDATGEYIPIELCETILCEDSSTIEKPQPVAGTSSYQSPPPNLAIQQLLMIPPKQVIVVERMNSGARRFVILDFGKPVLLTELFMPSCSDLVTLIIDVWLESEDVDCTRLVVAQDIATKNVLLTDLQSPPLCRYMKITVIGRYGMSTIRCRIHLGYFYGHVIVLPYELPYNLRWEPTLACFDSEKQLGVLTKLFEDISCRYNLSCSKLKELLHPFLVADMKNAMHLATYMNILKDRNMNVNNIEHSKVLGAYQETIRYQHQLNIIKNVISRIESSYSGNPQYQKNYAPTISTDKLTGVAMGLLEALLSIDGGCVEMSRETCQQFFRGLCVSQPARLQILAAIFLEKSCGKSQFWGDFLADTLAEYFSTSCTTKFPQDRLFLLLCFLSRKPYERSTLIDAALRIIYDTTKPLTQGKRALLAVTVDLPLLSWQLMYLSLQLSLCRSPGSLNRWNWILGELMGKGMDNVKPTRKKSCKRLTTVAPHPNYNMTPKVWQTQMTTKEPITKVNKYLKKKMDVNKAKEVKDSQQSEKQHTSVKMPQLIDFNHCLAVAKALLNIILSMDHSSSVDTLLLAFKVVSRLVTIAKLKLGQLISENQLLELINFCFNCKISWAPFALACFLQDSLEVAMDENDEATMDTEISPRTWQQNENVTETEVTSPGGFHFDLIEAANVLASKATTSLNQSGSFPNLPSVYESEDSDFEEILEDYQKIRTSNTKTKTMYNTHTNLSCAMDSRLELGVQSNSEVVLKKTTIKHMQLLLQSCSMNYSSRESNVVTLNPWPNSLESIAPETSLSNQRILMHCFQSLFASLHDQDPHKIQQVLQLWLTLNSNVKMKQPFVPSIVPKISLSCNCVKNLIKVVSKTPGLSIKTWCLTLQTLTLVCNVNCLKKFFDLSDMVQEIISHEDFVPMIMNLLTGTQPVFNDKVFAGPALCKALHDFIVRLQMRCDIVNPSSKLGTMLKTIFLKVIYQLSQPNSSFLMSPLDAQCKLLQSFLYVDFTNVDLSIAMSTLENTASLLYRYIMTTEKFMSTYVSERQNTTSNTFSDIFASVLGSDANKQDRLVTYKDLLILMVKIIGKLVQTHLPEKPEVMDTGLGSGSQTDESKAEQIQQESLSSSSVSTATSSSSSSSSPSSSSSSTTQPSAPCFADIVLNNHEVVIKLCRCLAACKSSSLCMLANVTQKAAFLNLGEPNTIIGDTIFYLLTLLIKKASQREMLIAPLLTYFKQTTELSEPLLWFVLQVLDNEDAIKMFYNAGGIVVLGRSIVNSCLSPSTLSRIGTISSVMQHFSGLNTPQESHQNTSSMAGKKTPPMSLENKMSLINFAPHCTITCESGTAQPADVLTQGFNGVTHRRTRTPLWSYHFYPEEVYTELILHLPTAILLKEVHLHPHSVGLATCPSYVALEDSSNGVSRLTPTCPPLPTSGLTYIRIHLPVPKVVNCVLIRLYKPRDANSIGLLQIKLLGSYAFSGSFTPSIGADDELHCKHTLGWLRLLHHCFVMVNDQSLAKQIVECASKVSRLLTCCCSLLLVPSHILPVYLPCLEKVLRELALHNPENGFLAIKVLLESGNSITEPLTMIDNSWQDRLINVVTGYQLVCELLYQICDHQDFHTSYRVKIILNWLENMARRTLVKGNTSDCNVAYISSIASILWSAKQSCVQYDLKSLITKKLFDSIYDLNITSQSNISLKYALDSLLCSICYIRREFFVVLLQKFGVLVPISSNDSISDDRKDSEGMTDDSKQNLEENSEWYRYLITGELSDLNLTREQLETIALVSRSPTAIQQLIDSGLPKLLNNTILKFCCSNYTNEGIKSVSNTLQFFTDVCDEKVMRDWLGSEEGSSFWLHLLQWLCKKPVEKTCRLQSEARVHLEEVCVKFLAKCCLCHSINQTRLAKVLCDVINMQSDGISGFMRRLILQLLLENEKVPVSIESDETLYKSTKLSHAYIPAHPAFKQTYNHAMLCLSTNTTLLEILEQHIFFNSTYKTEATPVKKSTAKKDIFKNWIWVDESEVSMAAGVTAKDKRAKDAKNQLTALPQSKKKKYTSTEGASSVNVNETSVEGKVIKCETFSDQALPLNLNLGQLLRLIESKGITTDWPYVHLKIFQSKGSEDKNAAETNLTLQQQPPICSALQVFSSMGGLALLAQHLPTVYPETIGSANIERTTSDQSDSDWIKVIEDCDDIYEDITEDGINTSSPSKSSALISQMPPHSLTSFGLFLRLPGYAEVLLNDMKRALCLLRLVLGVVDDGEGGDIFHSPLAETLPTLPFEILKKLYDATPLSTDDGRLLRRLSIHVGVMHTLLACLAIFTHQSDNACDKENQGNKTREERPQLYWAKGTGFGTGSTQQSWNVEQALLKQKNEEDHVTVLLLVLASYINPNDSFEDELNGEVLPAQFYDLLAQSTLLPAISSYLRNDSVLDMARHIPLYKAVLQLLRALALSPQLVNLLLPQKNKISEPSVSSLLRNMKTCVDTYTSKLGLSFIPKAKSKPSDSVEDMEQGEGLAMLVPDIQNTANVVSRVTSGLDVENQYESENPLENITIATSEEQYLRIMKNLQFGSYEMITELPEGGIKFTVSYHFENSVKNTNSQSHPGRVKRIAQEAVTLSTSLPLSYSSSVFVRYDTSRLDVMKVLITGPADTPYANGCFELDVYFPLDYPQAPMLINLETTGHHTVRFNPNLYNDGKVCLSVLNTWHGRPEEKWNAQTSSFLQVLVSIQSLILVPEPYFNEPGYERARGTPAGSMSSREYNLNVCQATVRWAMLEQILHPCECFKEIIHTHFYIKRYEIIAQVERWINEVEREVVKEKKTARMSKKSPTNTLEHFKKVYKQLKEALMKLKPPMELEEVEEEDKTPVEDDEETATTPTNNMEVNQANDDEEKEFE